MSTHHYIPSRSKLNINISGIYLASVAYLKNLVVTRFYISQHRLWIFIAVGTVLACSSSMSTFFELFKCSHWLCFWSLRISL